MRILYRLVSSVVVCILPIVIVFYSIVWAIGSQEVYLSALKNNNFYERLSSLAKDNSDLNAFKPEDGIGGLLLASAIKDFSPSQWQNLIEGNIKTFSEWVSGAEPELVLYIPTDDLETNLSQNLDKNLQSILNSESQNLPECSSAQMENIQTQGGFDPNQMLCIPSEVKSGEKTLSEFFGIQGNQTLDKLLQNNYLNLQRDRYDLSSINAPIELMNLVRGPINFVRDQLLWAKNNTANVVMAVGVVIVVYIIFAWLAKKDVVFEIGSLFKTVGFSVFVLSALVILTFGGTYYLNAALLGAIAPVFGLGEITNLVLWTVINIAFNLLLPAIWLGVFFIFLWLAFRLVYRRNRQKFQAKNEQILNYQPDYTQAQTMDSQFRTALSNNHSQPHINSNNSESPAAAQPSTPSADLPQINYASVSYSVEPGSTQTSFQTAAQSIDQQPAGFPEDFFQNETQEQQGVFSETFRSEEALNPTISNQETSQLPTPQTFPANPSSTRQTGANSLNSDPQLTDQNPSATNRKIQL